MLSTFKFITSLKLPGSILGFFAFVFEILYNHVRVLHIYYYFIANRYSLRLEAMLQKEEFQITLDTIEPSIEALKGAMEGEEMVSVP